MDVAEQEDGRKSPMSSNSSQSGSNEEMLTSHAETMAPSHAATNQRDLILETLLQIERICSEMSEDPPSQKPVFGRYGLVDIVARPSTLGERRPVSEISIFVSQ